MTYIEAWLEEIYSLVESKEYRKAIDIVFDCIDDFALEARFEEIDEILPAIDISKLDENLMVAFLAISKPVKPKLKNYDDLYLRIEEFYKKTKPEEVEEILKGLK